MTPVTLRCTQKLAKLLGTKASKLAEPSEPAETSDWYANLLWIERKKCILFAHAETLFCFLVTDVRKADYSPIGPLPR